jgi:Ca2+-binding EF-hand superfamily protein
MSNTAEEIDNIFDFFDPEQQNQVRGNRLGEMMRAVGLTPDERADNRAVEQVITRQEFQQIVLQQQQSGNSHALQELVAAFKMFDTTSSGHVSSSTMRNILGNLGEKLQADEIEIIIQQMSSMGSKNHEGEIAVPIETFCQFILQKQ